MKKIMFLAIAVIAMVFSACSKDDDNSILNDTTWVSTEEADGIVYAEWKLNFQESTFKMEFRNDEDGDGKFDDFDNVSGSYKVDGSNVSLSASGYNMRGTIDGDVMHFPETADSDEFTFYKK